MQATKLDGCWDAPEAQNRAKTALGGFIRVARAPSARSLLTFLLCSGARAHECTSFVSAAPLAHARRLSTVVSAPMGKGEGRGERHGQLDHHNSDNDPTYELHDAQPTSNVLQGLLGGKGRVGGDDDLGEGLEVAKLAIPRLHALRRGKAGVVLRAYGAIRRQEAVESVC